MAACKPRITLAIASIVAIYIVFITVVKLDTFSLSTTNFLTNSFSLVSQPQSTHPLPITNQSLRCLYLPRDDARAHTDALGFEISHKALTRRASDHGFSLVLEMATSGRYDRSAFHCFIVSPGSSLKAATLEKIPVEKEYPVFFMGSGFNDAVSCSKMLSRQALESLLGTRTTLSPLNIDKSLTNPLARIYQFHYGGFRGPLTKHIVESQHYFPSLPVVGEPLLTAARYMTPSLLGVALEVRRLLSGSDPVVTMVLAPQRYTYGCVDFAEQRDLNVNLTAAMVDAGWKVVLTGLSATERRYAEDVRISAEQALSTKHNITKTTWGIISLQKSMSVEQALGIMAQSSLVLAFSFEAAALSASVSTPFIAYGYALEVYELANLLGCTNFVVNSGVRDTKVWLRAVTKITQQSVQHKQALSAAVMQTTESLEQSLDLFFSALKGSVAK